MLICMLKCVLTNFLNLTYKNLFKKHYGSLWYSLQLKKIYGIVIAQETRKRKDNYLSTRKQILLEIRKVGKNFFYILCLSYRVCFSHVALHHEKAAIICFKNVFLKIDKNLTIAMRVVQRPYY